MSDKMSTEMRRFLSDLAVMPEPATRGQIGCVTSRAAEKARRDAKRLRYARQAKRKDGKWGWAITEAGLAVLQEVSHA